MQKRTQGQGCPQCASEARRNTTRQPSISDEPPHLLAEWDWEANVKCGVLEEDLLCDGLQPLQAAKHNTACVIHGENLG